MSSVGEEMPRQGMTYFGHPIAVDALEASHLLVVGTTGSGKTYLARGLLEQLRRANRRVGAIDKLGKLWGLTLAEDGNGPGLEFIIFGGKRAHVPMTPADGHRLGRLFVERNIPAIFDLSQWTADDQEAWVADFCDALFLANETALHLLIDEAQSFVPVNGGGDAFKSVRRLAEQGRGNGVNLMLTAPRLSRVDATVRGAMQGVIAMRQTSTVDRKATVELLAGETAIDEKALSADLPGLPTGTGYVWIPAAGRIERIAFPANATFDSSRTPRHGDTPPAPIAVSGTLVDELRAALAPPAADPPIDDTIPADPAEAHAKGSAVGAMIVERDRRIAEIEDLSAQLNERLESWMDRTAAEAHRADHNARALDALRNSIEATLAADAQMRAQSNTKGASAGAAGGEVMPAATSTSGAARGARSAVGRSAGPTPEGASPAAGGASIGLTPSAMEMLSILKAIAPAGASWAELALLAVRKPAGGSMNTAKKQLRDGGWVEESDGDVCSTEKANGEESVPLGAWRGPDELRALWGKSLGSTCAGIIARLGAVGGREEVPAIGAALGKAAHGGSWNTAVKALRTSGVAERDGKALRLHPLLISEDIA